MLSMHPRRVGNGAPRLVEQPKAVVKAASLSQSGVSEHSRTGGSHDSAGTPILFMSRALGMSLDNSARGRYKGAVGSGVDPQLPAGTMSALTHSCQLARWGR
eukprot:365660-Chlamydomonas_euryale.AAC.7